MFSNPLDLPGYLLVRAVAELLAKAGSTNLIISPDAKGPAPIPIRGCSETKSGRAQIFNITQK
jgi:hypothetical protein